MVRAPRKPRSSGFYEQALTEAERSELAAALEVEGLDEEIATLRLRLRQVLAKQDQDFALMLKGLDALRRMVVARYGLSKEEGEVLRATMLDMLTDRMVTRGGDGESHDDT